LIDMPLQAMRTSDRMPIEDIGQAMRALEPCFFPGLLLGATTRLSSGVLSAVAGWSATIRFGSTLLGRVRCELTSHATNARALQWSLPRE
jgi:hypothetical protein